MFISCVEMLSLQITLHIPTCSFPAVSPTTTLPLEFAVHLGYKIIISRNASFYQKQLVIYRYIFNKQSKKCTVQITHITISSKLAGISNSTLI